MKPLREPIRSLVGRYEAEKLSERHGRRYTRRIGEVLQDFFERFPRKSEPRQFHICDVEDYKEWRRAEGYSYTTVRTEVGVVQGFFNWLIRVEGFDLTNPVVGMPWPADVSSWGCRLNQQPSQAGALEP